MQIQKVKFEDIKAMICVRGEHFQIYEAIQNLKKGEAIKIILDNPKSVLSSLVTGHYRRNKLKKDYSLFRLKNKGGWVARK